MKENLHFKHSRLNYINSQKQRKKEHIRLEIISIGVDVVAKTDDEVNSQVLSKVIVFIYFLCCAKEDRVIESIETDVAALKILTTMQKL